MFQYSNFSSTFRSSPCLLLSVLFVYLSISGFQSIQFFVSLQRIANQKRSSFCRVSSSLCSPFLQPSRHASSSGMSPNEIMASWCLLVSCLFRVLLNNRPLNILVVQCRITCPEIEPVRRPSPKEDQAWVEQEQGQSDDSQPVRSPRRNEVVTRLN